MTELSPIAGSGCVFFFNDTATTEIYTLSLHDALPISEDLDAIWWFIADDNPEAADRVEMEIGRASCRERVEISVVAVSLKKKNMTEAQKGCGERVCGASTAIGKLVAERC